MMELPGIWEERCDENGNPYWLNIETDLSTSVRPTSGVIPKKQEAPKAPPPSGWIEKFDYGTGKPYWINIETELTTDVRPTSSAGTTTDVRPTSSVGTTKEKTQVAAPVDSPGIWEERCDENGKPYWLNIETDLSTSVRPTSGVIPKKQEEASEADLPDGWIEKFDYGTGTPYWVDTSTGLSTSFRPTS